MFMIMQFWSDTYFDITYIMYLYSVSFSLYSVYLISYHIVIFLWLVLPKYMYKTTEKTIIMNSMGCLLTFLRVQKDLSQICKTIIKMEKNGRTEWVCIWHCQNYIISCIIHIQSVSTLKLFDKGCDVSFHHRFIWHWLHAMTYSIFLSIVIILNKAFSSTDVSTSFFYHHDILCL